MTSEDLRPDIRIVIIDTCFVAIDADESIKRELQEKFTFEVPGFQFMPAYQNGSWTGKIHLYNLWQNRLSAGLIYQVIAYAKQFDYTIEVPEEILRKEIPQDKFDSLYDAYNLPSGFTKEEHQTVLIKKALELKRALILSPTGSGKSLIIYALCKTLLMKEPAKKALIIVPTKNLVSQFAKEIKEYGFKGSISKFSETKDTSGNIIISTYHSLYKLQKKFFDQFSILVFDETHLAQAKSTTTLMSKTSSVRYKFGTTATLKDTKCHLMALEGMFGPIITHTTTKKLIDAGKLTPAKIIAILLKHPEEVRKENKDKGETGSAGYQKELELITTSEKRNIFIRELVKRCENNTLILFNLIEHGKKLKDIVSELGLPVYYIDGGTGSIEREFVREQMEKESKAVLIASIATTGTGFNCKNLHNVIFVHPTKSKIRVMQAIGRILRLLSGKKEVKVFDIADDLSWKKKKNITLEHFLFRLDTYQKEEHPLFIKEFELK